MTKGQIIAILAAAAALAVAFTNRVFLYPVFLLLGICVGVPMTAVSMHAGRTFGARSAARARRNIPRQSPGT